MNYKKIINFNNIEKILSKYKIKNKKIVQCHGVFDLLHIGHLKHFETAKKQGDILIVSVTPDQYIDKGFNRPFFKNQQRLESLSSIADINYVVLNNSSTAVNIIDKIREHLARQGKCLILLIGNTEIKKTVIKIKKFKINEFLINFLE